jgi:mRNA-degrading endonuclease RelE of RelBE toxin-antitoxin system
VAGLNIVYFPKEGNKHSPIFLLDSLCSTNEIAHFKVKLDQLSELETGFWNFKWLEYFQNLYQVTQGNFRLYFEIIDENMVVSHVCRKVGRKARSQDLERARLNLRDYRGE